MDSILAWINGLPGWLATSLDVIIIAIIFLTGFTLVAGIWVGFCITRRRMDAIVELQFFPPRIIFKEKSNE
jgi:ribose/xylose/arabinose/galactoside ABC-type transport system permease subunit